MKRTYDYYRQRALDNGYELITPVEEFKVREPALFRCKKGHTFKRRPQALTKDRKCPICFPPKRDLTESNYEFCDQYAKERGGQVLTENKNCLSRNRIEFQCAQGHCFKKFIYSLKNEGTWCNTCKKIEYWSDKYRKAGFRVIVPEGSTVLVVSCMNGHSFSIDVNASVKSKLTCPVCDKIAEREAKKKDKLPALLEEYNLELISSEPTLLNDDIIVVCCEDDHESTYMKKTFLRSFTGCPHCKNQKAADMIYHAASVGLRLITINNLSFHTNHNLLFKCEEGHYMLITLDRLEENNYSCFQCRYPERENPMNIIEKYNLTLDFAFPDRLYVSCSNNHKIKLRPFAISAFKGCPKCEKNAKTS